jgi:hypothetical protein
MAPSSRPTQLSAVGTPLALGYEPEVIAMYEFPMSLALIPNLTVEFGALQQALNALGAVCLGATAVLFLVILLPTRRRETRVESDAAGWDAKLRDAA